jgi:hypothetical protein
MVTLQILELWLNMQITMAMAPTQALLWAICTELNNLPANGMAGPMVTLLAAYAILNR